MKFFRQRILSLVLAVLALALIVALAAAQSGGGYDLTWNTVDGGGGASSGGAYTLIDTIGQADAGTQSGGAFTLHSGFWPGAASGFRLYLPLIQR